MIKLTSYDLSKLLATTNVWCMLFVYADDMVLLAPSPAALQIYIYRYRYILFHQVLT